MGRVSIVKVASKVEALSILDRIAGDLRHGRLTLVDMSFGVEEAEIALGGVERPMVSFTGRMSVAMEYDDAATRAVYDRLLLEVQAGAAKPTRSLRRPRRASITRRPSKP